MNLTPPLRVLIVEDMHAIRQSLEDFLRQQPGFIVTGSCATVHDAVTLIHNSAPDLLLLDIGLPDGTGFDILGQISTPLKVIFLTAHSHYAVQAFEYGAIHYLTKPYNEQQLSVALQRAINAQPLTREQIEIAQHIYKKKALDRIVLRCQEYVKVVMIKDITYFEANNKVTNVFLHPGNKEVSTRPLGEYDKILSGTCFLRTHHAYLLNEFYIDRYHPKDGIIYLNDATEIPVSSRKKEMVDQYFKTL